MGCLNGDREKGIIAEEQKWHYITLDDFKSRSCITRFSYGWLWFLAIVSVAVYALDTFTAVNLLAFNRWSSQVKPAIPFAVSKWIFTICILLSWVLLGFEYIRAIRVIRRGGVAESYLDPLAVVLQSMRPGSGKGAIRVLLAETPRQFVNAVTLFSVSKADLVPAGQHTGGSPVGQFFDNIKILAHTEPETAAILGSMAFTFVIWFLSALSLLFALLFYLLFLWHYIPSSDGRLSIYCRRKINQRVSRVVSVKVRKAIEDQERKERKQQLKEDREAIKKGIRPTAQRQPTLPTLEDSKEDKYAESVLSRSTSQSTLPPYTSRPPTRNASDQPALTRQPTLPGIDEDAPAPMFARMNTNSSTTSFDSDAPLLSDAGGMGMSEPIRKPLPYGRPPMNRNMSSATQMSRPSPTTPAPSYHSNGYRPGGGPLSRQNTQDSMGRSFGPPTRTNTQESFTRPYGGAAPQRQNTGFSDAYEMSPQTPANSSSNNTIQSPADRSYTPYNPARSAAPTPMSNNSAPILSQPQMPRRDVVSPPSYRQPADYFSPQPPQRSATMPTMYEDFGGGSPAPGPMPLRSATAGAAGRRFGPGQGQGMGQGVGPYGGRGAM
ncbi:MAG: hypothetical protein Q9165_002914 [Trypethelium subeluteriae]